MAAGIGIAVEADTAVTGNVIENAPTAGIMLGWGHYLRDVAATGNVVRKADIGIAVSVATGAGTALIANNVIADVRRGAIVGMDRTEASSPATSPRRRRALRQPHDQRQPRAVTPSDAVPKHCPLLMCASDAAPCAAVPDDAIFPVQTHFTFPHAPPSEKCSSHSSPCSCFPSRSMRRSMPARIARRASATPTGRASACCRPRPPIATRGCWSSPAAPAAGRAFSRSIAGSCSSRKTPPPGAATTWSAGASRSAATAGRPTAAGSAISRVVLLDVRGGQAEALIPKVKAAIAEYGYNNAGDYRVWPGPNSNTFTATVLRAVPELETTLPPNAVGKDFRA